MTIQPASAARGFLCLLALATLPSCIPGDAPAGDAPAVPPPTPVMVVAPEKKMVSEADEFTGRVEAAEIVEIRPRITGYLKKVNFQAGQLVKAGDVLFEIDPRWDQAALNQAEAAVNQARAAVLTAESEAGRAEKLGKSRAISAEEAETRVNALTQARAALHAAEAARETAQLNVDYTKVVSPITGRVSRALMTEGNYVSGVAGFTTLLTTVVSVDPVYIYVAVDEASWLKYLRLMQDGTMPRPGAGRVMAGIQLNGETGFPHKGWIESFDNRLDAATGSGVMRLTAPSPDGELPPGAFARVRIAASPEKEVLLVDEKLIGTDQNQRYVLTIDADSKVAYNAVTLGGTHEGKRIVLDGLTGDEKIIASGLQMLRPKAPVTPLTADPGAEKATVSIR